MDRPIPLLAGTSIATDTTLQLILNRDQHTRVVVPFLLDPQKHLLSTKLEEIGLLPCRIAVPSITLETSQLLL